MDVLYDYLSAKFRRRLPLSFVYINTKHSFNTINGRQCAELPTCKSAILAKAACFLSIILCFLKASLWYASAI